MSGVKHTPGPWEVLETGSGFTIYLPKSFLGNHIAYMSNGGVPVEQEFANARLIGAAPDHHAVALELDRLALVIESAVRFADPAFKEEVQALLRANKAAIARARGEQDGGGE